MLFSEEEATIDNYDLPHFMIFDSETETLSKDTTSPSDGVKLSPLERILNFIKAAIDFIVNLLTGKK